MNKKRSQKDSQRLGKFDMQTKSSSDDDVIMLGTDDSSPEDWLPDISLGKKLSPAQSTSRPVTHKPSPIGQTSKSSTKKVSQSLKTGKGNGQDLFSKNKLMLSTPKSSRSKATDGNELVNKKGMVGARSGNTADSHSLNAHRKTNSAKSLDCMDLFAITRAGEGTSNANQGRVTPAQSEPIRDQRHLARGDNKVGKKKRKHSLESSRPDKNIFALASKTPLPISFSEKKGPQNISSGRGKASDTSSKQTEGVPLKSGSKNIKHRTEPAVDNSTDRSKHLSVKLGDRRSMPDSLTPTTSSNDNRNGILLTTLPKQSSTLEPSKRSLPVGKLPSKPQSLPMTLKHPLSSPTGQHNSAHSHSKSNYPLSPPAVCSFSKHPPSLQVTSPSPRATQTPQNQAKSKKTTSLVNNEGETESSSVFDFDESDLFEVLDSVESESIYSAYNQSDTESMGTGSEGYSSKPTSESDQHHPSSLIKSHTCKSPFQSRMQDFAMSFVKKSREKRQVAKKSTTLNGAKFFKHPLKGRGLLQMRKYCTLRLTRLHKTVVRKANQVNFLNQPASLGSVVTYSTKHTTEKSVPLVSQVNEKLLAKRKRDVEVKDSSTPVKRPKLSPDPVIQSSSQLSTAVGVEKQKETSLNPAPTKQTAREKDHVTSTSKTPNVKSHASNNDPQPKKRSNAQQHQHDSIPQPKQLDRVSPQIGKCLVQQSSSPCKPLPLIFKSSKAAYKGHHNIESKSSTQSGFIEASVVHQHPMHKPYSKPTTQSSSAIKVNSNASSVEHCMSQKNNERGKDLGGSPGSSVTPEKMLVSSEPSTPVSKKYLSLKRNRTHSFSEESKARHPMSSSVSQPSSISSAEYMVPKKGDSMSLPVTGTAASQVESNTTAKLCIVEPVHQSTLPPSNQPPSTGTSSAMQKKKRNHKATALDAQEKQLQMPHSIVSDVHVNDTETCQVAEVSQQSSTGVKCSVEIAQQVPHKTKEVREHSYSRSRFEHGLANLSPRDKTYNFHLLQTIAKLAPSPVEGTDNRHTATSMENNGRENMEVGATQEDGACNIANSKSLVVKLPLFQLSRTPSSSPTNQIRTLGMSKEVAVQADRGMIVDKDVLDAYLVVKLHEAMFDMKEQLQLMESQLASIAKQKQSLERTLEAKTKYIRDMTTTGIRASMVDKGTSTDTPPLFRQSRQTRSSSDTSPFQSKMGSKGRKNTGKLVEKGVQTVACDRYLTVACDRYLSVSCQTEGVVRTVPGRLQTLSLPPMCLYNHPDSELQIFIEESRTTQSQTSMEGEEETPTPLLPSPNHNWLSTSIADNCSRAVAVSPKVRFLRELRDSTTCTETYCAKCSTISQQSQTASTSTSLGIGGKTKCKCGAAKMKVCISPPLHTAIMKLVELYFKLKSVPKEPVQERHMISLIMDLQHLLMHLPVDIEPPSIPVSPSKLSPAKSSLLHSAMTASTPPPVVTSSDLTPVTPPSSALSTSSPPSTPGTASWVMGVKLQELVNALCELEEMGKEVFPMYFKAELAKLQKTVQDTLKFLTSGIQHETFTHNNSGCIVDSDLHPRPWRSHELHKNHFFRRFCLDVGIRNLVWQVRRLTEQNRKGKKLGNYYSDDSDLDSISEPPTPRHEKSQMGTGSRVDKARRTRKERTKVNSRKSKAPVAKGERIGKVTPRQAKKEILHLAIPAPAKSVAKSTSPSVSPMMASTLPNTASTPVATNTPHSSSLQQTSPYSKHISKGETFQVRVEELHSSLKVYSAPQSAVSAHQVTFASASNPVNTTVHLSSPPIASIPCNIDALGGNVSAQRKVAECIRQASQTVSTSIVHPASCAATTNNACSAPLTASHTTVTTADIKSSTAHTSVTMPHIEVSTVHNKFASATPCVLRSSLRSALESFARLLFAVQLTEGERVSLQRLIQRAYGLAASSSPLDLQMAQLFINQVGQQLHIAAMRTVPTWNPTCGRNNVLVQPIPQAILPIPSNTQSSLPQSIDIHPIANIPVFTVTPSMNTQTPSSTAQGTNSVDSTVTYSTISLPAFKDAQVSTVSHSRTQVSTAPLYTQATSGAQTVTVADTIALSKTISSVMHNVPQSKQDQAGLSDSSSCVSTPSTTSVTTMTTTTKKQRQRCLSEKSVPILEQTVITSDKCTTVAATNPKPTSDKQEPTTTIQKPATSDKQVPTTTIPKLATSNKQVPTTTIPKLATSDKQVPTTTIPKLATSDKQEPKDATKAIAQTDRQGPKFPISKSTLTYGNPHTTISSAPIALSSKLVRSTSSGSLIPTTVPKKSSQTVSNSQCVNVPSLKPVCSSAPISSCSSTSAESLTSTVMACGGYMATAGVDTFAPSVSSAGPPSCTVSLSDASIHSSSATAAGIAVVSTTQSISNKTIAAVTSTLNSAISKTTAHSVASRPTMTTLRNMMGKFTVPTFSTNQTAATPMRTSNAATTSILSSSNNRTTAFASTRMTNITTASSTMANKTTPTCTCASSSNISRTSSIGHTSIAKLLVNRPTGTTSHASIAERSRTATAHASTGKITNATTAQSSAAKRKAVNTVSKTKRKPTTTAHAAKARTTTATTMTTPHASSTKTNSATSFSAFVPTSSLGNTPSLKRSMVHSTPSPINATISSVTKSSSGGYTTGKISLAALFSGKTNSGDSGPKVVNTSSPTPGNTCTAPVATTVRRTSAVPASTTVGRISTAPVATTVRRTSAAPVATTVRRTSAAPVATTVGRISTAPVSTTVGRISTAPVSTTVRRTSAAPVATTVRRTSAAPVATTVRRTSTAPASINASHLCVNKRTSIPLIIARHYSTTTTSPSVTAGVAVTTVHHSSTHTSTTTTPRPSHTSTSLTSASSTAQPVSSTPTLSTNIPTTTVNSSIATVSSASTAILPLTTTPSTVTASTTTPICMSTAANGNLMCPPIGPIYSLTNVSSPETSNHNSNPALLRQLIYKSPPPVVRVQASKVHNGLLIKWTFAQEHLRWQNVVKRYDLYAFVCNKGTTIPDVTLWGKVGEIKPLALPMAVTLTNFAVGQRYAFAVRVRYTGNMTSCYSNPCTIDL